MLWSARKLPGYTLKATDGRIGRVSDLFFHDQTWVIEYLVVKLGTWSHSQEVLIHIEGLGTPLMENNEIPVPFTKAQIEQSPVKGTNPPVSEQEPIPLQTAHQNPPFQGGSEGFSPVFPGVQPGAINVVEAEKELMKAERHMEVPPRRNPYLRSIKEILGYTLRTSDGKKVWVEDFLFELTQEVWLIRWMVASKYRWWPGKKVFFEIGKCKNVDCVSQEMQVDMTYHELKDSPATDVLAKENRS